MYLSKQGMVELNIIKGDDVFSRVLCCPRCKSILTRTDDKYFCPKCAHNYASDNGILSFIDHDVSPDSFDATAFEFLFNMEQKHFWHIGRKKLILDLVQRNVTDLNDSRMLEIGCGNGSVLAYLKQNNVTIEGSDIFMEALKFCRRRVPSVPLYQADILCLPFLHEFDIVGLFDILEHIEYDEKALLEVGQVLKPGGKLIITVPAHKLLWGYFDESSRHKRRYSRPELVAKVERNGYSVKKCSFYIFFLFPLFVVIRLLNNIFRKRGRKNNLSTSVEVKTIPLVNELFLFSLTIEKYLIRHMNLPFGASLVLIAEKKTGERYENRIL
jgi:SAM-dependent methyltransferase